MASRDAAPATPAAPRGRARGQLERPSSLCELELTEQAHVQHAREPRARSGACHEAIALQSRCGHGASTMRPPAKLRRDDDAEHQHSTKPNSARSWSARSATPSGTVRAVLAALGDRLGLFRALQRARPLHGSRAGRGVRRRRALRAGVGARHARRRLPREAPARTRFALPPEHAQVLAAEGGPFFLGGAYELTLGYLRTLERLTEAFRSGGGVPQSAYPSRDVGRHVPLLPPVLRPRARAAVDSRGRRPARAPRGGRRTGPTSAAAAGSPDPARAGVPELDVRRLRRLRGPDRARPPARRGGGRGRARPLRAARRGRRAARALRRHVGLRRASTMPPIPSAAWRAIRAALRPDGTLLVLEMRSADDPSGERRAAGDAALRREHHLLHDHVARPGRRGARHLRAAARAPARAVCACRVRQRSRRSTIEDPFNALYVVRP